ncbi:MAG: HdeD family acid-resistance protein [Candidatus Margulisiibacteriota bacterium]|nr:MAG: hypothetical protein A2X43_13895 [Candidatus Margulisbacteria bacterium GWD2_39_127]OGI05530.1 MAG: hypothetical protein A2X42_00555 [Candidatus Margulisbacteria bacterium GWF2_38_17]OGI08389.1 MAG: hypothetical protein A2X41_10785 [Candidatus Margulisbacteria bacterium GWE2_39_32]PZM77360.1 MAG: HdeD family acid-resistance protein [Candidatus Margulisiibacteriota bacterium]HAR63130.1 hypothetical protein [Candidatus Margulisiibacteriota bacterium]
MAEMRTNINWLLGVNGIVAIIFGLAALFFPGIALVSLVFFFGLFAVISGIVHLFGSLRNRAYYPQWGTRLFEGILSIAIGLAVMSFPGLTVGLFLVAVALWALVTGIFALVNASRFSEHRGLNIFSGIVSLIFAGLIFTNPFAGIVATSWLIGIYALILGVTLISVAATTAELSEYDMREREKREGNKIEIHKKAA